MNGKHRARWIAEQITELQRLQKKTRDRPEAPFVAEAISKLHQARTLALSDKAEGDDDGDSD